MEKVMEKRGTKLLITLPAEVDHCFSDKIREAADRRIQTEDISELIFDFQDTEFMDSSGIGLLMGRYQLMRALGGEVKIIHAGVRVRKILMLSGIHKIISIREGVQ